MSLLSVKVVLISTGILSMAMGLKLTVHVISHFIVSEAPTMWTFILTCFTPPYLYILLNLIILTIVASSKFHNSPPDTTALLPTETVIYAATYDGTTAPVQIPAPEPVKISDDQQTEYNGVVSDGYAYEEAKTTTLVANSNGVVSDGFVYEEAKTATFAEGNGSVGYVYHENSPAAKTTVVPDEDVTSPSLLRKESLDFTFNDENVRPPVSARFSHRKAVKASPEGGKVVALGVTKPKRQDTLESTWRAITEGRAMPLTRHLKKSETWDTQPRRNATPLADLNGGPVMKKSETFSGREKSVSPASGGKMRKEPLLGQDELNRRVEAFINKFNAEMRLQRQESLRQYREMVNRGAH